jgi:hypothetical protein
VALTRDKVKAMFGKLAGDDPGEFFEHVSDEVRWTVLGTHPLAGEYRSKSEFQQATFERLGKLFEGGVKLYLRSVLLDGDRAAVELYSDATSKAGIEFKNEYCWLCRFDDETIVEVRAYLDSALVAEVIARGEARPKAHSSRSSAQSQPTKTKSA